MDLDAARFLTGQQGERLLEAARESRSLPPHRRVDRLRTCAEPDPVRIVLEQDALRERAQTRCPHAERLLFTREALEQATAWPVAADRASRWPAAPEIELVDLCAGIGLDALAAASAGRPVTAVERDPVRAHLLRFNAEALGLSDRVRVVEGDAGSLGLGGPLGFLDPDRRAQGRRTRAVEAFEPPRSRWEALLAGFEASMVKLQPTGREIAEGRPFEVVSLDGRARECRVLWSGFDASPPRRALSLPSGCSIEGAGRAWPTARPPRADQWLIDPDPAVTLAGLVGDLAEHWGLAPVHPRIAWLVGDDRPRGVPGRVLRIDAVLRPRPRELNAWLRDRGVGQLEVKTRGVAQDAAAWRRRLRVPGGEASAVLAITRTADDRWVALGSCPMTRE